MTAHRRAAVAAAAAIASALLAAALLWRRQRDRGGGAPDEPGAGRAAVAPSVPALVGGTPLLVVPSLSDLTGARIVLKLETANPGGSSKDRVALRMIRDAEAAGALRPGGTLVEGTSGSTGVSLALLARALGYRCHVVLPDDTAAEKRALLAAAGATVRVVPPLASVNAEHYVNAARAAAADLVATHGPGAAFFCDQFDSPSNAAAHYAGTGPEVWAQTGGRVAAFVNGAGTGGTLAGVGRFLHEAAAAAGAPRPLVVLADPPGSALFNRVAHGVAFAPQQAERTVRRHRADTVVEGVGLDRVSANFAAAVPHVDAAVAVADAEAIAMARFVLAADGIFVGSSTAIALVAAVRVARALRPRPHDADAAVAAAAAAAPAPAGARRPGDPPVIVALLCDSGERHLSRFWAAPFIAAAGLAGAAEEGDAAARRWRDGGSGADNVLSFVSHRPGDVWMRRS